jgi:hypothetical protein
MWYLLNVTEEKITQCHVNTPDGNSLNYKRRRYSFYRHTPILHSQVIWWLRRYATSRYVKSSSSGEVIDFLFNLPNVSGRTVTQGFTQPLTEISTGTSFCGKARPARRLTTSPPSVNLLFRKWDPRCLTTLQASTACKDSFSFFF